MPGRATAPAAEAAELLSLALLSVLLLLLLLLVRVLVLREVDEVSSSLAVDVETEVEVDSEVMVVSEAVPEADPEPVWEPDAVWEPLAVSEAEPEGAAVSVAEALVWVMPRLELNWLANEAWAATADDCREAKMEFLSSPVAVTAVCRE